MQDNGWYYHSYSDSYTLATVDEAAKYELTEVDHVVPNRGCRDCILSTGSTNVCLISRPKPHARLMIVIDSPNHDTEESGDVYRNEKMDLLYQVLSEIVPIDMESVYISYMTKCRSMDGRQSEIEEAEACMKYLEAEIEAVQPKAILTLGTLSMQMLTGKEFLGQNRGEIFMYNGIPVIPTYNPMFVKYEPENFEFFCKDIERINNISIGVKSDNSTTQYKIVKTEAELDELYAYICAAGEVSMDIETEGLNFMQHRITICGCSFQHGSAWVVPLFHFDSPFLDNPEPALNFFEKVCGNPSIRKYGWNFKFDKKFFMIQGMTFAGRVDDGMLMHHALDENVKHGLKEVIPTIWPDMRGYDAETKTFKWAEVPLEILSRYCATDADYTLRLCHLFEHKLMADPLIYRAYRNINAAALKVLSQTEFNGMLVDKVFLNECIEAIKIKIESLVSDLKANRYVQRFELKERSKLTTALTSKLEVKILQLQAKHKKPTKTEEKYVQQLSELKSGALHIYDGINFNSTKQLGELFYGAGGFNFPEPYDRKKRAKARSTGEEYLIELPDRTGFVKAFVEYRSLAKTLSTYYLGILDQTDFNNRIHPNFKLHGTKTQRLSCSDPNMQNVPRMGEFNGLIKKIFKARPGYKIMQLDYSQAELRLVALAANEENMIAAYAAGQDLHLLTAMSVMGFSKEAWEQMSKSDQKEMRNRAKAINFGFIYGMGAKNFMDYAKKSYGVVIDLATAEKWRDNYFRLYPALEAWHRKVRREVAEHGFVRTLFGSKRRLPDVWSSKDEVRGDAERQGINSPIQGTAGQCTVFAMVVLLPRLPEGVTYLNTVHDSIIMEVPENLVDITKDIAVLTCEDPLTREYFDFDFEPVGMKVDVEVGDNWKELVAI